MDDVTMTRLCAEAMGARMWKYGVWTWSQLAGSSWHPLTNDAQAMELVKQFKVECYEAETGEWEATTVKREGYARSTDLNRAIVECVAKMQAATSAQPCNGHCTHVTHDASPYGVYPKPEAVDPGQA